MRPPERLDATRRRPGFLVALCLDGRPALVVGGGSVAAGRVGLLLEAGAEVTLVAPRLCAALSERVARQEVRWIAREARASDLDGWRLVLVAIDDAERSAQLARAARARGALVNVADAPALCDFVLPAVHRDGVVEVAVTTAGAAPGLAARLRDELASHLPADLPAALRCYATLRRSLRVHLSGTEHRAWRMRLLAGLARTAAWRALASMDVEATVRRALALRGRGVGAPAAVRALMGSGVHEAKVSAVARRRGPGRGEVWLAGAGLGAPALLTAEVLEALRRADLVVCDRLVPPQVRDLASGEVRVAQKAPGHADRAQAEIERWLVEGARAGRRVLRLKAGDPFVFGRGQEEVERLAALGIPTRVLPGVSSALAAPLLAGIPLTCRGVASAFSVQSGVLAGGRSPALPAFREDTTHVWLMAVRVLPRLCRGLVAGGWPATLPAALVERAGQPEMRAVRGTLATIDALARSVKVRPPAVLILGHSVALAPAAAFQRDTLGARPGGRAEAGWPEARVAAYGLGEKPVSSRAVVPKIA